jgi:hypothetical protein
VTNMRPAGWDTWTKPSGKDTLDGHTCMQCPITGAQVADIEGAAHNIACQWFKLTGWSEEGHAPMWYVYGEFLCRVKYSPRLILTNKHALGLHPPSMLVCGNQLGTVLYLMQTTMDEWQVALHGWITQFHRGGHGIILVHMALNF